MGKKETIKVNKCKKKKKTYKKVYKFWEVYYSMCIYNDKIT